MGDVTTAYKRETWEPGAPSSADTWKKSGPNWRSLLMVEEALLAQAMGAAVGILLMGVMAIAVWLGGGV